MSARKSVLYDEVNAFEEIHVSCSRCDFVGSEIYERGRLVKCIDVTPIPKEKPDRIRLKTVKVCPYCGKYCDAKSGMRYDFAGHIPGFTIRQFAHFECSRRFGFGAPTPFGPQLGG